LRTVQLMNDYRFLVYDDEGLVRRFRSKQEAEWFMNNKPELTLKTLPKPENNHYQKSLEDVGECLF